jgi:alpha-methylacyl-CoA racemase
MAGPLSGYRIIELAGIGPGPFAAMLLADMGAEVVRVERAQNVRGPAPSTPHPDVLLRGRRNIAARPQASDGVAALLDLVASADGLIEGFRPQVMERLGLGPDVCLQRNPRLVFGRMTGWGQSGMYADAAGHDINYISLAGALAHFGRQGQAPVPPLNMVGDFGGGGMFLAFGMVCAILEAQRSGSGQVVDAAMVDGSAVLMSMFWTMRGIGLFDEQHRGTNLARHGCSLLRRVRVRRRQLHLRRFDRAEVLRRAIAPDRSRRRPRVRQADGQVGVAASEAAPGRSLRVEDARRVVRR